MTTELIDRCTASSPRPGCWSRYPLSRRAVLLLAGQARRQVGPLARRRSCRSCCSSTRVMLFFSVKGQTATARSTCTCSPGSRSAASRSTPACCIDPLSLVFVLLITGVGSLIHIYAVGYMAHDPGRRRFFGYFNLFIAAMLLLVLADNYLVLYVGWEGVGLASYLLIGFYYNRNSAATAGNKAFFANRVGDVGLSHRDHADVRLLRQHVASRTCSSAASTTTQRASPPRSALMLLLGACGKSGQFPLQTWLPDAMEGPTPVSALIHAATMVTAGVYLIARSAPIFDAVAGGAHRGHDRRRDHAALRLHLRLRRRTTSRRCSPTRRSARSATCSSPSGSARASTRSASSTCSATASSRPRCSCRPARSCTR